MDNLENISHYGDGCWCPWLSSNEGLTEWSWEQEGTQMDELGCKRDLMLNNKWSMTKIHCSILFYFTCKFFMKRTHPTDILDLIQRPDLLLWTVSNSAEDLFVEWLLWIGRIETINAWCKSSNAFWIIQVKIIWQVYVIMTWTWTSPINILSPLILAQAKCIEIKVELES